MSGDEEFRVACGARLRRVRNALGFPIRRAFAKALQVDENTLQKWENGAALVPPAFTQRLKELWQISHDYIYGGDPSGLPQRLHTALLDEEQRKREA